MRAVAEWVAAAAVALLVTLALGRDSRAATSDYLGSKECGSCHSSELRAWQEGPHAGATGSLAGASGGACLACHTTGAAPLGGVVERAVGCEACHGPGRGYAPADVMRDPPLARALGLQSLDSAAERRRVCRGCHRQSTKLSPVSLTEGWKQFGHGGRSGR